MAGLLTSSMRIRIHLTPNPEGIGSSGFSIENPRHAMFMTDARPGEPGQMLCSGCAEAGDVGLNYYEGPTVSCDRCAANIPSAWGPA